MGVPRAIGLARWLALAAALALGCFAAAPAGAQAAPRRFVDLPVALASGFHPQRTSRSIEVTFRQVGCGPIYDHARLRFSAHRLTVTLLARPGVPPGAHVVCPAYIAIRTLTIPLHRRLGARAIYDGGSDPPRLVARAPGAPDAKAVAAAFDRAVQHARVRAAGALLCPRVRRHGARHGGLVRLLGRRGWHVRRPRGVHPPRRLRAGSPRGRRDAVRVSYRRTRGHPGVRWGYRVDLRCGRSGWCVRRAGAVGYRG